MNRKPDSPEDPARGFPVWLNIRQIVLYYAVNQGKEGVCGWADRQRNSGTAGRNVFGNTGGSCCPWPGGICPDRPVRFRLPPHAQTRQRRDGQCFRSRSDFIEPECDGQTAEFLASDQRRTAAAGEITAPPDGTDGETVRRRSRWCKFSGFSPERFVISRKSCILLV